MKTIRGFIIFFARHCRVGQRASILIALGLGALVAPTSRAQFYVQESVQNRSGQAVDDLHMVFKNGAISSASLRKFGGPVQKIPATVNGAGTQADWASGSISIPDNRPVDIWFVRKSIPNVGPPLKPQPADIDFDNSYWTVGGNNVGGFRVLAVAPAMNGDPLNGKVTLFNPDETVPLVYSNIRLWKNCPEQNLDLQNWDTETGTLVIGQPTTVTVSPGQSFDLFFGSDNNGYEMLLADVTTQSDPSTVFHIGGAIDVPEPSALGLALLGLGIVRLRRR